MSNLSKLSHLVQKLWGSRSSRDGSKRKDPGRRGKRVRGLEDEGHGSDKPVEKRRGCGGATCLDQTLCSSDTAVLPTPVAPCYTPTPVAPCYTQELSATTAEQMEDLNGAVEEHDTFDGMRKKRHRKRTVSKRSAEQDPDFNNQTENTISDNYPAHLNYRSLKRKTSAKELRHRSTSRRRLAKTSSRVQGETQIGGTRSKVTDLIHEDSKTADRPVSCNKDGERFGFKFFLKQCSKIYTNPTRRDRYLLPGVTPGTDITSEEESYIMKCVAREEAAGKPLPYTSKRSVYKYWRLKYGITNKGICFTDLSDGQSIQAIESDYQARSRQGNHHQTSRSNEEKILVTPTVQIGKKIHEGHKNHTTSTLISYDVNKEKSMDRLAKSNVGNISIVASNPGNDNNEEGCNQKDLDMVSSFVRSACTYSELLSTEGEKRQGRETTTTSDELPIVEERSQLQNEPIQQIHRYVNDCPKSDTLPTGPITINIYCGASNTSRSDDLNLKPKPVEPAVTGELIQTVDRLSQLLVKKTEFDDVNKTDVTGELIQTVDRLSRSVEILAKKRDSDHTNKTITVYKSSIETQTSMEALQVTPMKLSSNSLLSNSEEVMRPLHVRDTREISYRTTCAEQTPEQTPMGAPEQAPEQVPMRAPEQVPMRALEQAPEQPREDIEKGYDHKDKIKGTDDQWSMSKALPAILSEPTISQAQSLVESFPPPIVSKAGFLGSNINQMSNLEVSANPGQRMQTNSQNLRDSNNCSQAAVDKLPIQDIVKYRPLVPLSPIGKSASSQMTPDASSTLSHVSSPNVKNLTSLRELNNKNNNVSSKLHSCRAKTVEKVKRHGKRVPMKNNSDSVPSKHVDALSNKPVTKLAVGVLPTGRSSLAPIGSTSGSSLKQSHVIGDTSSSTIDHASNRTDSLLAVGVLPPRRSSLAPLNSLEGGNLERPSISGHLSSPANSHASDRTEPPLAVGVLPPKHSSMTPTSSINVTGLERPVPGRPSSQAIKAMSRKNKSRLASGIVSSKRSSYTPLSIHNESGVKLSPVIGQIPSPTIDHTYGTPVGIQPQTPLEPSVHGKSDGFERHTILDARHQSEVERMAAMVGSNKDEQNITTKEEEMKDQSNPTKHSEESAAASIASICNRLGVTPSRKYNIQSVTKVLRDIESRRLSTQIPHRFGPLVGSPSNEAIAAGSSDAVNISSVSTPLTGLRRGKKDPVSIHMKSPDRPQSHPPQTEGMLRKFGNITQRIAGGYPESSPHSYEIEYDNVVGNHHDQVAMGTREPFDVFDEINMIRNGYISAANIDPQDYLQDEMPYELQNEMYYRQFHDPRYYGGPHYQ